MRMTSGYSRLRLSVGSEMVGAFRDDQPDLLVIVGLTDPSTSQTVRIIVEKERRGKARVERWV